jgi:hypothetical protein
MPATAYVLASLFVALSIAAGVVAWRVIGPPSVGGLPLPVLLSFGALYLLGHRFGWQAGPMIEIMGFKVAIVVDVGVALVAAFAAALLQRAVSGLFGGILRRA